GVQGAPGVELVAVDGEAVRGGAQGDAAADDPAVLVEFDAGQGGQCGAGFVDGSVGGGGELFGRGRVGGGEQSQAGVPSPATGLGGGGAVERAGQLRGDGGGVGVHRGLHV